MEPIIVALICAASFGGVVAIAAFVRQIILSKDKLLNDEAQRRAITQETSELEKMRQEMQNSKRFDSHYKILGSNKEAIIYLDNKIEEIFHKKTSLIERYSQLMLKESEAIVDGKMSKDRKEACDRIKLEIDKEIRFYDKELATFQQRRTSLWDTHKDLQDSLLMQEQKRNSHLDTVYKQHASLLEKIYLRHIENAEHVAIQSINAGTTMFKSIIMAPIHFFLQYFNISSGISLAQAQIEQFARFDVEQMEKELNEDDLEYNKDKNTDSSPEKTDEILENEHIQALQFTNV